MLNEAPLITFRFFLKIQKNECLFLKNHRLWGLYFSPVFQRMLACSPIHHLSEIRRCSVTMQGISRCALRDHPLQCSGTSVGKQYFSRFLKVLAVSDL